MAGALPFFYGFDDTVFSVALHEPSPGGPAPVPEVLLHDLWAAMQFDRTALRTTRQEPVRVLAPGLRNADAGPDFCAARIEIDGITWCGDVEIHGRSAEWQAHRHHLDPRYNGVVLHVVLRADRTTGTLRRQDGSVLPELVLEPHLRGPLQRYVVPSVRSTEPFPCAARWATTARDTRIAWLEALFRERIEERVEALARTIRTADDLDVLLYERVMAVMGYAKNTEAMLRLGRLVPATLARSLPEPLDLEAVYLGAAGLLPTPAELLTTDRVTADYAIALADRFDGINQRLNLDPMPRIAWQYFRLRPANFPPLRLAQVVSLVHPARQGPLADRPIDRLAGALSEDQPMPALQRLLGVRPGHFWDHHYRLDRATRRHSPAIGSDRVRLLFINAVAPVLLLHARLAGNRALQHAVQHALMRLPAETDEVTRRFAALGHQPTSTAEAQGLHHLYRTRCTAARCRACPFGQAALPPEKADES